MHLLSHFALAYLTGPHYRKCKGGLMPHAIWDYDGLLPVFFEVTDAKNHELTIVHQHI